MKPETLRYYSSAAPAPASRSDLVFLHDMSLPTYIAEHTVIHKIDEISCSETPGSPGTLFDMLLSIQHRVMVMIDPHGYFETARHPAIPNRVRSRILTTWQAVEYLLHLRCPHITAAININYINDLDFREVTILCSMFAVDCIRAYIRLMNLEDVEKLLRWQTKFAKSMPRARGELQQYYGEDVLSGMNDPVEWDDTAYGRLLWLTGRLAHGTHRSIPWYRYPGFVTTTVVIIHPDPNTLLNQVVHGTPRGRRIFFSPLDLSSPTISRIESILTVDLNRL